MRLFVRLMIVFVGLFLASFGLATQFGAGATAEFVGAKHCAECHQDAYAAWSSTTHKSAYEALTGAHENDHRCLQCHGVVDREKGGVQCEMCHGSGRYYAQSYVMKDKMLSRIVGLVDPKKISCVRCHKPTAPTVVEFDHERMWKIIEHGHNREPESVEGQE